MKHEIYYIWHEEPGIGSENIYTYFKLESNDVLVLDY